ncbi:MAG: acylphosphatase [bacterium]
MKIKRMCYLVSGRVQGVEFREKARKKADEIGLFCLAENIPPPDGRVFLEVTGKWIDIVKIVSWMKLLEGVEKVVSTPEKPERVSVLPNSK